MATKKTEVKNEDLKNEVLQAKAKAEAEAKAKAKAEAEAKVKAKAEAEKLKAEQEKLAIEESYLLVAKIGTEISSNNTTLYTVLDRLMPNDINIEYEKGLQTLDSKNAEKRQEQAKTLEAFVKKQNEVIRAARASDNPDLVIMAEAGKRLQLIELKESFEKLEISEDTKLLAKNYAIAMVLKKLGIAVPTKKTRKSKGKSRKGSLSLKSGDYLAVYAGNDYTVNLNVETKESTITSPTGESLVLTGTIAPTTISKAIVILGNANPEKVNGFTGDLKSLQTLTGINKDTQNLLQINEI